MFNLFTRLGWTFLVGILLLFGFGLAVRLHSEEAPKRECRWRQCEYLDEVWGLVNCREWHEGSLQDFIGVIQNQDQGAVDYACE